MSSAKCRHAKRKSHRVIAGNGILNKFVLFTSSVFAESESVTRNGSNNPRACHFDDESDSEKIV